ncbi:MAG: hypothetical protein P8165_18580 [Deltaproteobacteria bacterium]
MAPPKGGGMFPLTPKPVSAIFHLQKSDFLSPMRIDDPKRAKRCLPHLNYCGLAAYWLSFREVHPTHPTQNLHQTEPLGP